MFEFLRAHGPTDLVAFGAAGDKTRADLLADATRIASVLPDPTETSQVLLVFQEDRYAMAAALLGALHRGHPVALPPNTRRESVVAVREQPATVAVVHDMGAGIAHRIEDLVALPLEGSSIAAPRVAEETIIAKVFTSGSTGEMTAWRKSAAELLGEAAMLGELFDVAKGARIVATVAPGHIYGLLFTVLMPLLRGAAFVRETPLHAGAIAERVESHRADLLVTVPLHVRALCTADAGTLASLRRVVSSTGPLAAEVADAFTARHGLAVTEILGSTETGGIAFRERREDARFRPFPGVSVTVDDARRLHVDSPFTDRAVPRPFVTADLAELCADGTFTHLGRSDGIVKIGGRRVSLAEMEERLRQHPLVRDAAVVAVTASRGRDHQLLAAVAADGSLLPELRTMLLERFDQSSLPRRMLALPTLPRETNGKLPRARVLRLFGLRPDGQPINFALTWGEPVVVADEKVTTHSFPVSVPSDYGWFDGHFPGYPVLAGAVQLQELILPAVQKAYPDFTAVHEMSRMKFTGRILPGDDVTVRVDRAGDEDAVSFEIRKPAELCAGGRITYRVARSA